MGGKVILNLDMEKSYDRLDWNFIFSVLSKFGFSVTWLDLIKIYVISNSFSVITNGESTKFFTSSCGLRQGDPL